MRAGVVGVILAGLFAWNWPASELRFVACDVGQGDAILLTSGFNQILVDGGPSGQRVLECLRRYLPFWDRRIELVVMTNSDADHSGGLADVVKRYQLISFVSGDGIKLTDTFLRLRESLWENNVRVEGVEAGDVVRIGEKGAGEEIVLRVLWPNELKREKLTLFREEFDASVGKQVMGASDNGKDINERSVVIEAEWQGYRILLTGDSGFQTEKSLLKSGTLRDIDLLKVGHHGSKYSTSQEYLMILRPEWAVISVGKNRYGHPTEEAIGRLAEAGIDVRRTDREGDVVVEFGD